MKLIQSILFLTFLSFSAFGAGPSCRFLFLTESELILEKFDTFPIQINQTFIDSLRIKLLENQQVELVQLIKNLDIKQLSQKVYSNEEEAYYHLKQNILEKLELKNQKVMKTAFDEAERFLNLSKEKFLQPVPWPTSSNFQTHGHNLKNRVAFPQESETQKVVQVKWEGVDSYVDSRLASLSSILEKLNNQDRVILSNLSIEHLLTDQSPESTRIYKMNLPLVKWEKEIYLVLNSSGEKNIIITGFSSSSYLTHFELLIRRKLFKQFGINSEIKVDRIEDKKDYNKNYSSLANFLKEIQTQISSVQSLVFGYSEAFKTQWKNYFIKSFEVENSPWKMDYYLLPQGQKVLVVRADFATYGEALGKQVKNALKWMPNLSSVFFAGSGGSLITVPEYSMQTPRFIKFNGDKKISNFLNDSKSSSDFHKSVISPLEETPQFLENLKNQAVTSVDMEVSGLAEELSSTQVKLGVGILITDFPAATQSNINLAHQDFNRKKQGRIDYVNLVYKKLKEKMNGL